MNDLIRKSIAGKVTLGFTYKGKQRWVEPHTYGIQKNGKEGLCAWQISGGSDEAFREFLISEISGVSLGQPFNGPRDGYHRGDQRFQVIHAEL
jgi:hypothetical protein